MTGLCTILRGSSLTSASTAARRTMRGSIIDNWRSCRVSRPICSPGGGEVSVTVTTSYPEVSDELLGQRTEGKDGKVREADEHDDDPAEQRGEERGIGAQRPRGHFVGAFAGQRARERHG